MTHASKTEIITWSAMILVFAFIVISSGPRGEWEPNHATNELTWTQRHWFKKDQTSTVRWIDASNAWCEKDADGVWRVVVMEREIDPQPLR